MRYNILRAVNVQIVQKRFYKKDQVRVRFAPSPTGLLHLGSLRTALYNYLFARANNGTFILRIEDTDQSRTIPGAIKRIQDDLLWAGIIPDEDPTRGGPAGPYIQSKRCEIYLEQVHKLLDNKTAYHCFCTETRLQLLRKEALKCRQVPKYDNKCRHLSKEEVQEKLKTGELYCIRFKLSSTVETFHDLVYGDVSHNVAQTEGDPVIMKSDGYPTYHFANVVDDHLMEISHVLRGVEWQVSTPKHIMLYKAFGWNPPIYGHLPLILNSDGSKLSKRQGDINIQAIRQQGIFPLALLNYVVYAGSGFSGKNHNQYIESYKDLIEQFNVSKIKTSSGKLMPEKLLEFNRHEISKLLSNKKNNKLFVERIVKLVSDAFPDRISDGSLQLDEDHIVSTLNWAQNRISKLNDLVQPDLAFLWVVPSSPPNITELKCSDAIKVLSTKLSEVDVENFKKDWISTYLKEFAKTNEVPFSTLMQNLRTILTGLKVGPSVGEMIEILGKDRTLLRINRCIS